MLRGIILTFDTALVRLGRTTSAHGDLLRAGVNDSCLRSAARGGVLRRGRRSSPRRRMPMTLQSPERFSDRKSRGKRRTGTLAIFKAGKYSGSFKFEIWFDEHSVW